MIRILNVKFPKANIKQMQGSEKEKNPKEQSCDSQSQESKQENYPCE